MRVDQFRWTEGPGWDSEYPGRLQHTAQLVLVFGNRFTLENQQLADQIQNTFKSAYVLGCSTAGEIYDTQITDDCVVVTAIEFENSRVLGCCSKVKSMQDSYQVGSELAQRIDPAGLVHVFVLSEGININGTELLRGLTDILPKNVKVTGGLSGDGERFEKTLVMLNGPLEENTVGVIGFYGENLKVGYGSVGGWDPFGPERLITKSDGNILYEMDNQSALELYKKYLGGHAKDLPASGLLFPLSLRTIDGEEGVVRTILSVDEEKQSMTFAGDVPEGSYARLMKANFDRLIDGAVGAAKNCTGSSFNSNPELAILISCVGRKMILKQRTEEEVEGVKEVMGDKTVLTGFYSYGEMSPLTPNSSCELHNQTMTITTISEVADSGE